MTHTSRKKNAYKNYDETARTQIQTGYEVICFGWGSSYFNICKYVILI
jgi:hypothetical protein